MPKFRFSTRTLLIVTLVIAIGLSALLGLYRAGQRALGIGPVDDPERWPRALQKLTKNSPELRDHVSVYVLGEFLDHESIWLIEGQSSLIDQLFAQNSFVSTSPAHPKAERLLSSIPYSWPELAPDECSWHATPGFGSSHIEGVDLFLVMRDETRDIAIVLHRWVF